jgi:hypothetical protein
MKKYQTFRGVSSLEDTQVVYEASLLDDWVQELAIDGVDVDCAIFLRVESDGVEGVCGDMGKVDRQVAGMAESTDDCN